MTYKEFKKKFKLGDKITWGNGRCWDKIVHIGKEHFTYEDEIGYLFIGHYINEQRKWRLYKEKRGIKV